MQEEKQKAQREASAYMPDTEFMVIVDSILTGITNENYIERLDIMKRMTNTIERLKLFVDIFHKKAVDEQIDIVLFGKICQHLLSLSVKESDKHQQVNFRNCIVNKCQKTFETWNSVDDGTETLKVTETFSGAANKKELENQLVCDEPYLKQHRIQNILLIGQLYKVRILNSAIMMRIMKALLERKDDNLSLEAVCQLLTSIGKVFEAQCAKQPKVMSELEKHFITMEQIMKDSQITSRVKSLINNVIKMRKNNWMSSLGENGTTEKTTAQQIHKHEHRPDECGVCMSPYDEGNRRPRNLPCGHTFCSKCVCALMIDGSLTCPACRTDHSATDANQFPISYALEDMMKAASIETASGKEECEETMFKEGQTRSVKHKWKTSKSLSKKMRSMIQEQRINVESLKNSIKEELEQLKQYRSKLAEYKDKHSDVIQELNTLVQQHQTSIEMLIEEDMKVKALVGDGEEVERELQTACDKLDKVTEAQNAITCIDEADHTVVEVEEWLQHIKEDIPNCPVLRSSFTMFWTIKPLLDDISKDATVLCDEVTSGHSDCSIMEAVTNRIEGIPVKFVDLYTEKLQKILKADRVFAVQEYEGDTCYSSQVKSEENKVYLYSLNKKPPPPCSFTLEVKSTLENITITNISVFMDLTKPLITSSSQRVLFTLASNTPLIKYFVTLCLGHTGIGYCNTMFQQVDRYYYSDLVWGPNISSQEGVSNQSLPPIQEGKCSVNAERIVVVRITGNTIQFGIRFQSNNYGNGCGIPDLGTYHLGNIDQNGQVFLQEAINNSQIPNVRVENCGIVC